MLYIGLEYGLTNNSKLAERFFSQALSIAPEDPFVIHEVGVVAFQNGEWVMHTHTHKMPTKPYSLIIVVLILTVKKSHGGLDLNSFSANKVALVLIEPPKIFI